MRLSPRMQHVMTCLESGDHWTRCPVTEEVTICETGERINPRTIDALVARDLIDSAPYLPILGVGGSAKRRAHG